MDQMMAVAEEGMVKKVLDGSMDKASNLFSATMIERPYAIKRGGYSWPIVILDRRFYCPPTAKVLFNFFVKEADETDNGIIPINVLRLHKELGWSRTTIQKDIRWLIKHNLLRPIKRSKGRIPSRYLVRWTFKWDNIVARKKAINAPQAQKIFRQSTAHPLDIELQKDKNITTLSIENKTQKYKEMTARKYKKKWREMSQEIKEAYIKRSINYAIPQLRNSLLYNEDIHWIPWDYYAAYGRALRLALESNKVSPGEEFKRLVQLAIVDVKNVWFQYADLTRKEIYAHITKRINKHFSPFLEQVKVEQPQRKIFLHKKTNKQKERAQCRAAEQAWHNRLTNDRIAAVMDELRKTGKIRDGKARAEEREQLEREWQKHRQAEAQKEREWILQKWEQKRRAEDEELARIEAQLENRQYKYEF